MRKAVILVIMIIFCILLYFTIESAKKVLSLDWIIPEPVSTENQKRFVLITQEVETPFWNKVSSAAISQAKDSDVNLEVWGSYSNNYADFLKKLEIAIHSKMDGIIVQGLDSEEFTKLTKIKASFYGIPIITVANDVPMEESLRKTYVGSDQYEAGKIIASELILDMGESGEVVLLYDEKLEYYQQQRLNGIQDFLSAYPFVQVMQVATTDNREEIINRTRHSLNILPEVDAFIAVDASMAEDMIGEVEKRFKIEPFFIYTFDDGPVSLALLEQGKLDAMIEQEPDEIGRKSVKLLMDWLMTEGPPLNPEGYLTDIRVKKAANDDE